MAHCAARDSGAAELSARDAHVQFRVLDEANGPALAIVFIRNGELVPPNGRVFTLELSPETKRLEADTLASLLNQRLFETRGAPATPVEDGD